MLVYLSFGTGDSASRPGSDDSVRNEAANLQAKLAVGWNTWDNASVLTHVLLPEGLAIELMVKDYESGDILKEALIGREDFASREQVIPGPRTYDGTYTELELRWRKIHIRVQSASINNDLYLLVTPINISPDDSLIIVPQVLWGRKGEVLIEREKIIGKTPNHSIELYVNGEHLQTTKDNISVHLNKAVAISPKKINSAKDIAKVLEQARTKVPDGKNIYPEAPEQYNAMHTVLAWNTIYDPINNRVITPVSRNWSATSGGWVLFDWDTYFAAYMLSLDNKDLAYANALAITKEITKKRFIPNMVQPGFKSEDRSQPPVGSLIIKEIYNKYREKWFLEEVFDNLLSWNRFWANNRDVDGYLCWGSDPYVPGKISKFLLKGIGTKIGAQWESGMDNSPMWDEAFFDSDRHRLLLADVGLMSLYIADCQNLSEMAEVLGKPEVFRELKERAEKYSNKLKTLWDDQFGLYLNKDLRTGQFSYRLSPTLFYPLLTKVPSQEQAERMIKEHFYNPREFWGKYILPSIARNDPAYKDNNYWRGRIWAPLNFLVYLGLRNYNLPEARKDLVEKSAQLLLQSWTRDKHVFENYNAETGQGNDVDSSDAFYHWGALLGFISIIDKGYMPAPENPL
ncbi:MAG: MGH1-like glycoside hydrolase domain-containing protein, partial [Candidatus Saccharicenans sp.]